jgi:hypothetical protein
MRLAGGDSYGKYCVLWGRDFEDVAPARDLIGCVRVIQFGAGDGGVGCGGDCGGGSYGVIEKTTSGKESTKQKSTIIGLSKCHRCNLINLIGSTGFSENIKWLHV